jgi:hypothetical protein
MYKGSNNNSNTAKGEEAYLDLCDPQAPTLEVFHLDALNIKQSRNPGF